MASSKKKSLIQRTLVVNMRSEPPLSAPIFPPSSSHASRSFRRRSQETPTRDSSFRREGSAHMILLFRPPPEAADSLENWKNAIQERLISPKMHRSHNSITESIRSIDGDHLSGATPSSPSSLFLVNGEPNTTLLSPSIRSRSSNLSSIESSDDRESYISSPSEVMSSPRLPDSSKSSNFPHHSPRPVLHLRTTSSQRIFDPLDNPNTPLPPTAKRETILDRFFSTAPPSPADAIKPGAKPMSSIARFEALMNDLDSSRFLLPTRPVSQPVSRTVSPPPPAPPLPPRAGIRLVDPDPEDYDDADSDDDFPCRSDVSIDTVQSTLTQPSANNILHPPQSKRHSMADFSMMQRTRAPPPSFGERRGSWSGDGVEEREEEKEESTARSTIKEGVPILDDGVRLEFSGRQRNRGESVIEGRQKIFRDFSF